MTRCHSVFSCFSPPCPVHCRLVASERFATREPLVVLRTSGSAPKFPISMTLFRLRLTTGLQTMGGRGPRASTVYESQVILSIKDTPLGLKFCRHSGGRNTGPENHRVFHRPATRNGVSAARHSRKSLADQGSEKTARSISTTAGTSAGWAGRIRKGAAMAGLPFRLGLSRPTIQRLGREGVVELARRPGSSN